MIIKQNNIERFLNFLIGISCLSVFGIILQIFVFASFRVPTDSMLPTIQTGDQLLVNKLVLGPRIFNLKKAMRGETVEINRLPGLRKIKYNDILVFHNPYPRNMERMEMHLLKYYVKRCLALPGDTISVCNGYYKIADCVETIGNLNGQKRLSGYSQNDIPQSLYKTIPFDTVINWNILNLGPLYVPKKGDCIIMDRKHFLLYRNLIEWEQKTVLEYKDSLVYMNDILLKSYTFQKDYYFMGGDCVDNSIDSRYWGMLPEEYVVGKVSCILYSVSPFVHHFRWNRFLKFVE